jgi:hypothetical protein
MLPAEIRALELLSCECGGTLWSLDKTGLMVCQACSRQVKGVKLNVPKRVKEECELKWVKQK